MNMTATGRLRRAAFVPVLAGMSMALLPAQTAGDEGGEPAFRKIVVDTEWRAETSTTGDVNKDGRMDILIGDGWYESPGPDAAPDKPWMYHAIRPPTGGVKGGGGRGWHDCSACFAHDVNGDGWVDQIAFGEYHRGSIKWYENPRNQPGHWKERSVAEGYKTQCPVFADLFGDGEPLIVTPLNKPDRLCWIGIPDDPEQSPWERHDCAPAGFLHGLGIGDVNGDGRRDVIAEAGWYEAPADRTETWTFHAVNHGGEKQKGFGKGYAHMHAFDVDGDGDNDVLASSGHGRGVYWLEQLDTPTAFRRHEISSAFDNSHCLVMADLNGDGLQDLVTGRRYYGRDWDKKNAPLYWFELRRPGTGKPEWIPHKIDDQAGIGSSFVVADMNGDKKPDIVIAWYRGTYVFVQND